MVLEILFNLTILDSNRDDPLILLATGFLNDSFLSYVTCHPVQSIMNIKGIKHLVDLLRKLSTLSTEENEEKEERISRWQSLPSATSLVEAGIIFKRGASRSILDVKFIDGVLEIPPLPIHKTTETIFRNLINYEQCHPKCEARVTSYVVLLDSLIDTANDMNILYENHIINHKLNPQDSSQFFNKLYNGTYVNHYYYKNLSQQVNDFCRCRFPRWSAVLVRNYFNTPWSVLSALATTILLIMTFLQTMYDIKK
ncbi:hypothetical protein FH972_026988 [Carpinus fangiana]|uniref:Uncharacterized protein n=1 Tax=Carpinus fangiana TaxID=176857 RepID=A0A5N6L5M5_9ROSI|nr:hypothetical protein FH972_026988 [Carpinus fangiana]